MNPKKQDFEVLRKDIQVLKAAVSLVCDWISEKFDIEILDKTEFLRSNSGNKDLKEIEQIRLKITGEDYDNISQEDQTPSRGTKTSTFPIPIPTDDSESSYKNHAESKKDLRNHLDNQKMQEMKEYDDEEDDTQEDDGIEDSHSDHHQDHLYHHGRAVQPSTSLSSSESQLADVDTISKETCSSKRKITRSGSGGTSKRPRKLKPKPSMSSNASTISEESTLETIQCEICGKFLNGTIAMKRHSQTHKNIRPHICSECGKSFQRNFHLKTHMMIHTGDKKHQCRFCGRLFLLPKDLICHERTHTGEKPFPCTYCPRRFTLKSHLVMHTRTHTGEKPYKCDMCDKCFSQSNSLRVHKKIHLKPPEDNTNASTSTSTSTAQKNRKAPKQSTSEPSKSNDGKVVGGQSAGSRSVIRLPVQSIVQSPPQQIIISRGQSQCIQPLPHGAPLITILEPAPVQSMSIPLSQGSQTRSVTLTTTPTPIVSQPGQSNSNGNALFVVQYPP